MAPTPAPLPAWPHYVLTAATDGTVTLDGPMAHPGPYPDRRTAVAAVAAILTAAGLTRPVRATATDPTGTAWQLLITPTGTATPYDRP